MIAGKTVNLQELEALIRSTNILQDCSLLQDLGIVSGSSAKGATEGKSNKLDLRPVKDYLFNLVVTQGFMGVPTLIQRTEKQFSFIQASEIQQLIQQLCQEQKTQIIEPKAKLQDQLICLVTKN